MTTYFTNLRSALVQSNEDEWWKRTTGSARHTLTAVCFRETSENAHQVTGSVLLAPIGFYYSLFHMGMAMLYMDCNTSTSELERMRHGNLQSLVQGRLVNLGLLPNSYLDHLRELQDLREYANYTFGGRLSRYDYKSITASLYQQTGVAFDDALKFICQAQAVVCDVLGYYHPIQTEIGDGFGDDLIRAYLSKADEERVRDYLLAKHLTT